MGIGRLVFQHEDAYVADIVVILEINDQEVRRFRFVAVSQELIEFTGRLGCQVVEGHRPVGQSLQLHLKGTGRIEDACLLGGIADDAVQPFADVFVDDIATEIEVFLGYHADISVEIKNMEYCFIDHHNEYSSFTLVFVIQRHWLLVNRGRGKAASGPYRG